MVGKWVVESGTVAWADEARGTSRCPRVAWRLGASGVVRRLTPSSVLLFCAGDARNVSIIRGKHCMHNYLSNGAGWC